MKKSLLLILIVTLFFISGCDLLNELVCDHQFIIIEEVQPSCENEGYKLEKCELCQKEVKEIYEKLPHSFTEWQIITEATEYIDGLKQRQCEVCGFIEKATILSNSYIDLDIIRFEYIENNKYEVSDYESLDILFNAALLNNSNKLICTINYEVSDFNELINQLVNNSRIPTSFQVSATLKNKDLELTLTYDEIAKAKTNNIVYTQYQSMNYEKYNSKRTNEFNDFKINKSNYSYNVSTTEQLVYALERNVKPICEQGSNALKIYNEIKKVLIEIIDDEMSDVEKVKAIYEWLILNVTYDNELLQLVFNNNDVKHYNGFYLEGVFLDNKAVCEGIAKAFAAMANIEGIPCVIVDGYQANNINGVGHAWNKVFVNGNWYIVDATSGGTIINDEFEILSYQYFLIDEKTMEKKYISNKYKDLKCEYNYNYYEHFYYNNNEENNYIISNQNELNELVKYFESNDMKNKSIEFKVTFDFGSSISDELQQAYSALNKQTQFSFITNENIIVLVK